MTAEKSGIAIGIAIGLPILVAVASFIGWLVWSTESSLAAARAAGVTTRTQDMVCRCRVAIQAPAAASAGVAP